LSQKELQRVCVISSCAKGDMACARAAELLSLSVRQVRRLKKRLRELGEAALAHANRGRPSPRRVPQQVSQTALRLARTTYAGFNDHHLCGKLCGVEGLSLSRETLRRLLRQAGFGIAPQTPRSRSSPAPSAILGGGGGEGHPRRCGQLAFALARVPDESGRNESVHVLHLLVRHTAAAPGFPVRHFFISGIVRRALMGLAIGATVPGADCSTPLSAPTFQGPPNPHSFKDGVLGGL
jgi:transposase